jgi:nitroreductase
MDTIEAIRNRRAIKHFDPDHDMTEKEIDQLLSLAILSPTAFNIQNWRFILARDPEVRQELSEAAGGQAQVTDASLLVVVCADLHAWRKQPDRYWRKAGEEVKSFVLPAIDGYYRGRHQVQRDEAMRSCGIAAQTLMLAAKSMGYDSCPMDGFDFAKVGRIINLPEDHVIAMFVAIGKGMQEAWPRPGQLPLEEVVLSDGF